MKKDVYGQIILSEDDICDALMKDSSVKIHNAFVDFKPNFNEELEISTPNLQYYDFDQSLNIEEFDTIAQTQWSMPEEYKTLDIAQWLLDKCSTDSQRQRVGEELLLYMDRNLFTLLQYLKYLVDTMRANNIVWGVGRGSSVSSYVLYLIGIHKIDSMYYDLDIKEFLR